MRAPEYSLPQYERMFALRHSLGKLARILELYRLVICRLRLQQRPSNRSRDWLRS